MMSRSGLPAPVAQAFVQRTVARLGADEIVGIVDSAFALTIFGGGIGTDRPLHDV